MFPQPVVPVAAKAGGDGGGSSPSEGGGAQSAGGGGDKSESDKMKKALQGAILTEKPDVKWDDVAGMNWVF